MTIAKQSLLEAAKAVLDASARNHLRKHHLDALRQAVQAEQDVPVYTPMTDDEILLKFDACDLRSRLTPYPHKTLMDLRYVERAIIESLGLRWPE